MDAIIAHMRKAILLIVLAALAACATGKELMTVPVGAEEEIPGLFTVIFAGRHYAEEVDAVVVLDLEGDEYTFVPKAKHKDFEVLKSLTVREAFYEAGPFFTLHDAFAGKTRLIRIQDPDGRTIGYELRPLYDPNYFGDPDVLRTEYHLTPDKRVLITNKAKTMLSP